MAVHTTYGIEKNLNNSRTKDDLKIPRISKSKLSLSDIIAATIGEDMRSCDSAFDQLDFNFGSGGTKISDYAADVTYSAGSDFNIHNSTLYDGDANFNCNLTLFSDNSNNACDSFGMTLQQGDKQNSICARDIGYNNDINSRSSFGCVPNPTSQDSNTLDSLFKDESNQQNTGHSTQTDFSNLQFDIPKNINFETNYEAETNFISTLCESREIINEGDNTSKDAQIVPENGDKTFEMATITEESKVEIERENKENENLSYDSDLEDSMQFVDPDDNAFAIPEESDNPNISEELDNPNRKKRRISQYQSNTLPFPAESGLNQSFVDNSKPYLHTLLFDEPSDQLNHSYSKKQKAHGISRTRSFSGTTHRSQRLARQNAKSELHDKSLDQDFITPTITRTRSFSEVCNREQFSPMDESRFNTSLSSLFGSPLENSPLSNNPFFSDLRSTLLSDCQSMDIPKALFETLSGGPKIDVYARERNLQSKFSSLQTKYPEEVRELSSFYRCQSATVETERFREIHDENIAISYRNHLNRHYDSQLHQIMERVEKSLGLLTIAKRDIVTINRSFRPRPLLSRKAVSMMEEWYTRNFEHPYPGPTAVEALAKAGEISPEQVKKWFANKRNRCKNTRPMTEVANLKRKRQFSSRW